VNIYAELYRILDVNVGWDADTDVEIVQVVFGVSWKQARPGTIVLGFPTRRRGVVRHQDRPWIDLRDVEKDYCR